MKAASAIFTGFRRCAHGDLHLHKEVVPEIDVIGRFKEDPDMIEALCCFVTRVTGGSLV